MKDRILNALMLIMVALALGLSFFQSGEGEDASFAGAFQENPVPVPTASPEPIEHYQSLREKQRRQELDALSALLANEDADQSLRNLAGEQLLEITQNAEAELALEAALAARGHAGICVLRKGRLTIFVADALDEAAAAMIFHLAVEIAGVGMENIRIAAC